MEWRQIGRENYRTKEEGHRTHVVSFIKAYSHLFYPSHFVVVFFLSPSFRPGSLSFPVSRDDEEGAGSSASPRESGRAADK